MDESGIAPVTALKEFLAWTVDALDQLQMRGAHDAAQGAFDGLGTLEDDATQLAITTRKRLQVIKHCRLVKNDFIVFEELHVEG